jgi:rare lipoprotein A (peptidoglycan hydrolase)
MLALGAAVTLMLAGCSSQNFSSQNFRSTSPSAYYTPPQSYRGTRTEVASWYGRGFDGHRTSSGEVFHSSELTAASTTLPLGSHAIVTNPSTGRSVVVRINDRGPFVHGRSIDLSHRAAQQIGLTGRGVGRVQVTPTARSTPTVTTVTTRTAVYRYSSVASPPTHLHYASYDSQSSYVERKRTRHHYHHYYSSTRTISASMIE